MRMEEKGFGWCVRNSVEPLVEGVKAAETTEFEGIQKELDEGKERTMEKKRQFVREMPQTMDRKET